MVRAHGGCLGTGSRRRTRQAAIILGEGHMPCDPRVSEWANPAGSNPRDPPAEHIRGRGATRGTETSKYPEEEKSTEIALVAASERAPAQTHACVSFRALLHEVLWGRLFFQPVLTDAVTKRRGSGTAWKGRPERVKAPYAKPRRLRRRFPSNAGHVKSGMNPGGPPSKAKYSLMTDSEPVP